MEYAVFRFQVGHWVLDGGSYIHNVFYGTKCMDLIHTHARAMRWQS